MNKFGVFITLAVIGITTAEPPISTGYAYSGHSGHGGGFGISSGDSYSLGGTGLGGISGGYTAVSTGYQTNEGQHVDPALLHKVKQILLDQENKEVSYIGGGGFGGGHGVSLTYGPPSSVYGVPNYGGRVVGIELGHIRQGLQVAQYHQSGYASVPSGSYGVPSGSYGVPSGSYGVPSGSYGVPHHY